MNKFNESEKTGWLWKWTNYIKGYQKRYFVLSDGVLSYYKSESEVSINCRGRIKLASAVIKPLQKENFLINRGVHDSFHLRAENEAEKQKWLNALNLAQREASKNEDDYAESNSADSKSFEEELKDDLDTLFDKLQDVKACQEKLNKSGILLQKLLTDLDSLERDDKQDSITINDPDNSLRNKLINDILKQFKEKNGSYKIALSSTTNSCNQFSLLAQQYFPKWCKKLQKEHETNKNYEQVINQLANHIRTFEEQVKENNQLSSYSNEDDEKFYDAEEFSNEQSFTLSTVPGKAQRILSHSKTTGDLSNNQLVNNLNSKNNINSKNNGNNKRTRTSSIKYEIKTNEPDESQQNQLNVKTNQLNDESSNNESSDREEDDLSLNSCNDDDNKLDEIIKSSVVSIENDKLNDSFSRNSSSNNIVSRYSQLDQNSQQSSDNESFILNNQNNKKRVRRQKIPERPNHSLNLWSFMKNSIGRDLSKIPMPVNFNEPLSMLQRITEDFEYAHLLHKAAKIKDSCEQLTYIAAFCVSNYATTSIRTCKPFNPLLGETFECDRTDDLGWKSIAEQVSHHPPLLAIHCEGKDWIVNSEFAISSKFRGKYLQVSPIDANHLEFPSLNYHYTWHKITTSVHNIIVGKLWVDNYGDMIITNHTTGDKCHIKFYPYSYFSREVQRKVSGVVLDKDGNVKYILKGNWDKSIEVSKVLKAQTDGTTEGQVLERTNLKPIWKRNPLPPDSEKMYNLTKLAIELNEPHEGVAPTDSTLRPDQRLMEEGNWTEANRIKLLLEQKQRDTRRKREEAELKGEATEYQPTWFTKQFNELVNNSMYKYNGDYWEKKRVQDWSMCPDIFTLDNI